MNPTTGHHSFFWNDIGITAELNAGAELIPFRCCSFDNTNDLWDVSQGTAVTASSGQGVSSLSNMFGATLPSPESGNAFFRDDQADGFVHFVEWQTPTPVELNSISLFAAHDGNSLQRSFKQFNLYAFNSAAGSNELILAFTPTLPYGGGELGNFLLLCTNITPTTSDRFRAEFVQNGNFSDPGPRVVELDGFSERIPEPVAADCILVPSDSTNTVGTLHTVTAIVTTNGNPATGVVVNFEVTAGPNAGTTNSATTDANGEADFSYTGQGGTGTDTITASGIVNCIEFSCTATKVWIQPTAEVHDLAIINLKAPKNINLQGAEPSLTKRVVVQIQNRSPHDETIPNLNTLRQLVEVEIISLGLCSAPEAVLIPGPPNVVPRTLKPKQKLNVFFDVTYTCANDPAKGPGHEDYQYGARVNHAALDGKPDTHPADDHCPRPPLPGGVDPNPDPDKPLKDKGCAGGAAVFTDVFIKQ